MFSGQQPSAHRSQHTTVILMPAIQHNHNATNPCPPCTPPGNLGWGLGTGSLGSGGKSGLPAPMALEGVGRTPKPWVEEELLTSDPSEPKQRLSLCSWALHLLPAQGPLCYCPSAHSDVHTQTALINTLQRRSEITDRFPFSLLSWSPAAESSCYKLIFPQCNGSTCFYFMVGKSLANILFKMRRDSGATRIP